MLASIMIATNISKSYQLIPGAVIWLYLIMYEDNNAACATTIWVNIAEFLMLLICVLYIAMLCFDVA